MYISSPLARSPPPSVLFRLRQNSRYRSIIVNTLTRLPRSSKVYITHITSYGREKEEYFGRVNREMVFFSSPPGFLAEILRMIGEKIFNSQIPTDPYVKADAANLDTPLI